MHTIKCVVVGDSAIGKTSLLVAFTTNDFPRASMKYVPTEFENFVANVMIGNEVISVGLWDTSGQAKYDNVRILSYPKTNVIIICFSIVNPDSFDNVWKKWYPEVMENCSKVPVILVGTKSDLRDDPATIEALKKRDLEPIDYYQGAEMARHMGAKKYLECSSVMLDGLNEIFDEAVLAVLDPSPTTLDSSRSRQSQYRRYSRHSCVIS